ncbi:MAG: hypothetical protein K940chlam4_00298 [Candidatus Anoxychlamydiales bacterium]|nr:hypothetical protein [Candidatus Anoxychlamydiales bacterium]
MKNIVLGIFATLLAGVGFFFIINAFFSPLKVIKGKKKYKKLIINGLIGTLMLFCFGLIIIYFFSLQDFGNNIENLENKKIIEDLPDISQY